MSPLAQLQTALAPLLTEVLFTSYPLCWCFILNNESSMSVHKVGERNHSQPRKLSPAWKGSAREDDLRKHSPSIRVFEGSRRGSPFLGVGRGEAHSVLGEQWPGRREHCSWELVLLEGQALLRAVQVCGSWCIKHKVAQKPRGSRGWFKGRGAA